MPLRRIGSGFGRANDLIRRWRSLAACVTVFPVNGCDDDLARVFGDMPESAEAMYTLSPGSARHLPGARPPGYYDMVWARGPTTCAGGADPGASDGGGTLAARIVLDTQAITLYREAMQAELAGEPYDLQAAMQAIAGRRRDLPAGGGVTEAEAETLRWLVSAGFAGRHMIEPNPTMRWLRSGPVLLSVRSKGRQPNFDSLIWFVDVVLLLIQAESKETWLTIAGYIAPGIDINRLEHPGRIARAPAAGSAAFARERTPSPGRGTARPSPGRRRPRCWGARAGRLTWPRR